MALSSRCPTASVSRLVSLCLQVVTRQEESTKMLEIQPSMSLKCVGSSEYQPIVV